ncbi:ATP synthase F0, subunit I [Oceanicola granulosus HTCC2516]|uniref:ATP synthase protein I n=1 Tax=Oceanicola granulosus (strain ATCC BAA-861 / DSM 15982 / KCTC 12143 / HTCC2516) TaxID=314256 RepID=Q2CDQ1_OCEGH|nr:AtpZ/AtpI family protein [Oceanicola granulosus]EAR50799.1 ATP synthase F0, subunit I [Oceanicola granulosus HTCC2516]
MPDQTDADRMKALEERIRKAKDERAPKPREADHHSQAQLAWRMVIELVAGLGIGFGIGYGLDSLLGTKPWLMVLFIFLGLAAGIKTMMRSAQEVQRQQQADEAGEDGDATRGS